MAYSCPRCLGVVQRGTSATAGVAGGALGALLYSAFGSFQCKECGPIAKREFAADVQRQMTVGSVGLVVFEAAHRDPKARVFWHLDDAYQGETVELHQMALAPAPGAHRLVLVDERGETIERRFTVVERSRGSSARLPGGPVVQLVRTAGS